jgi:hypothetical protein
MTTTSLCLPLSVITAINVGVTAVNVVVIVFATWRARQTRKILDELRYGKRRH